VEALFSRTKELVEATITKLGLDATKARVKDEPTQRSWTLQRGSASVLITAVHKVDQKNVFLRVASPVMTLPEGNREAVYKRLLELNAGGLANAAFGLIADRVVAVSERPAEGLDANEVDQIVRHLSAVADTYDDRLVKEFGGKRASDKS
jgi:CelD/BcsL family acetyltransferase involved in cellulose biosynthesis